MIEVNLLPGSGKKAARRAGIPISFPKMGGGGFGGGRWSIAAMIAAIVAVLTCGWLYFNIAGDVEDLEVQIEAAVSDSIRFADVIEQSGTLQARRDSIAQRVSIIQEIDQGRYVWPHIMDEVARAIPDYAWITRLSQVASGRGVTFELEGRVGTYFALTTLMENLEASAFVQGVRLISSEQVAMSGDGPERLVYEFTLEASGQSAPTELIETVPLFGPSVAAPESGSQGD